MRSRAISRIRSPASPRTNWPTRGSENFSRSSGGPSYKTCDSFGPSRARGYSITTRSATLVTVFISWVTTTPVVFLERWVWRMSSLITSLMIGSSPVVGSS